MFEIISDAYAAASGTGTEQSSLGTFVLLFGFIFVFYFLVIRPQNKKAKEHQKLISEVNSDDEVVTTGGIAGKIVKVTDLFIILKIANNVEIYIQKKAIVSLLPKGTLKMV